MNLRRTAAGSLLLSFSIPALLAGCAATPVGPTVGVMPGHGKTFTAFQADNSTCKEFSAEQVKGQADAVNQRAAGAAMLTTVLGAGLGAATGGLVGNAGSGAAIGAAAGAGGGAALGAGNSSNDQLSIQQQYDNAFSQCMYSKGNQVPGYAPVAVGSGGAPPDPTVRAAQNELNRLGYLKDPADGYAGGHTRTAISNFEQVNGLPVDGVASSGLLAKLQATPTSATAAAPSGWVAPTNASAPAPSGWVAPTDARSPPPQTANAAPAGWVSPAKSQ